MEDNNSFDINQLSDHLFWDVDRDDLDMKSAPRCAQGYACCRSSRSYS